MNLNKKESSKWDQQFSRNQLIKFCSPLAGALHPLKQICNFLLILKEKRQVKCWFYHFS